MQSNSRKLIIGGGISGLIWNFYNPGYQIITPEVGGDYGRTYMIWMHRTAETIKLLKDLGWENAEELYHDVYIGYFMDGWIKTKLTPEENLKIIQKKMTDWDKPLNENFLPKSFKMSTTSADAVNVMKTLDVDLSEVVKRLNDKAHIQHGFVRSIYNNSIVVTNKLTDDPESGRVIEYDKLVSTIAAPLFWGSYRQQKLIPQEFNSHPITNVITKIRPQYHDDKFEMIYYDDSVPYARTSKMGDTYAYEFTGYISKEKVQELLYGVKIEDYIVIKYGRIFEGVDNKPPENNMLFLGRFAEWKFGITTEHVVKKTLDFHQ